MSALAACCLAFCSSSAGTISVALSERTASAIRRSCGLASNPVRYAIDTGFVTYSAPRWRFSIHWRSAASGVETATDLLNAGDVDGVLAAGGLDVDVVADAMA